jgi:hypothetical protein
MPAHPDHQPLTVDSPAALLAVVPHLLGFVPSNSLVAVGTAPPRGRIQIALRFDLPDPPDVGVSAAIAEHAVSILARQDLLTAIVVGYGPGHLVSPLADILRKAAAAAGLPLRDVLRVDQGRYWSYLCQEPACCPAEGVPFDASAHPLGEAIAANHGEVLSSRDALTATVEPVTGAAAEAMKRETARAERIAARLAAGATQADSGTNRHPVVARGLAAVQAAIVQYREGGSIELASTFAWLALVLTNLRVRDDAWARMDPEHNEAHLRLWTDLTRRAQAGYVAAPASLLAFIAWQGGNGALANVALDRALTDDPNYSMAQLLRDTIDAGVPPAMAKLPMTPKEVAASYDRNAAPQSPDSESCDRTAADS